MRRKDREMSKEFGLEVIDKAVFGVLSMVDENNEPYGIPLSFVREDNYLYFHSAKEGKKVNIFEKSPNVSITFVGEVKVPEVFSLEDLEKMLNSNKTSPLISDVFTTQFESTIITGKVNLVEEEAERIKAMRLICIKYTPTKIEYFHIAIASGLARTNVYRVNIQDISTKRKKYDDSGKEMKFGRMI